MRNRKTEYTDGVRASLPLILGYIPAAIAYALMARQAGLTVWQTCALSLFMFTGAGEMMAVGMYSQGAGLLAIVLATFLLGLRHMIMSVCCMNRKPMRREETGWKLLGAFGITDEVFSLFMTVEERRATVWSLIGMLTVVWTSWNIGTLTGAMLSDIFPAVVTASLAIALYAMFIALILPDLSRNGRLTLLVVFTAVCNTLLCRIMASSWALILSTLLCAFIGVFFVDLDKEAVEDGQQ